MSFYVLPPLKAHELEGEGEFWKAGRGKEVASERRLAGDV